MKKTIQKLTDPLARQQWLDEHYQALEEKKITSGQLLRIFREQILNLNQDQYAQLVKI